MDTPPPPPPPIPVPGDVQLPVMPNTPGMPSKPVALLGILSYLSILCLVPLFIAAPNTFESYHAKQGLALFAVATIIMLVALALPGTIGSIVFSTAAVFELLLTILGTRNVLLGQREPLPLLGALLKMTGIA